MLLTITSNGRVGMTALCLTYLIENVDVPYHLLDGTDRCHRQQYQDCILLLCHVHYGWSHYTYIDGVVGRNRYGIWIPCSLGAALWA